METLSVEGGAVNWKIQLSSVFVTGYGKGYNMSHKDESNLTYMPGGMENVDFFNTSDFD